MMESVPGPGPGGVGAGAWGPWTRCYTRDSAITVPVGQHNGSSWLGWASGLQSAGSVRSVLSILFLIAVVTVTVWVTVLQLPGEASASNPDVEAPHVQQIQSVAMDGRDLPLSSLRAAMRTKAGGFIDDATLAADRRALLAALAERGYLAATVSAPKVTFDATGAYVVIAIAQGPQFKLRTVKLVAPEKARHVVTLATGDVANPARLERTRQTLAESLPGSSVTLAVRQDLATASVDVDLVVAIPTASR